VNKDFYNEVFLIFWNFESDEFCFQCLDPVALSKKFLWGKNLRRLKNLGWKIFATMGIFEIQNSPKYVWIFDIHLISLKEKLG